MASQLVYAPPISLLFESLSWLLNWYSDSTAPILSYPCLKDFSESSFPTKINPNPYPSIWDPRCSDIPNFIFEPSSVYNHSCRACQDCSSMLPISVSSRYPGISLYLEPFKFPFPAAIHPLRSSSNAMAFEVIYQLWPCHPLKIQKVLPFSYWIHTSIFQI